MILLVVLPFRYTVDSEKLEHGRRIIYAGCPSFFGFWLDFLASTVALTPSQGEGS